MYAVVRLPDAVPIIACDYENIAWDYCKWANEIAQERNIPVKFTFKHIRVNPKAWAVEEAFDGIQS